MPGNNGVKKTNPSGIIHAPDRKTTATGFNDAVMLARRTGKSVSFSQNGKVITVYPSTNLLSEGR